MRQLCAAGSKVDYLNLPGVKHGFAGSDSALAAIAWIDDRMDGKPAPSSCPASGR
jgi:acetyl esterase/lipase